MEYQSRKRVRWYGQYKMILIGFSKGMMAMTESEQAHCTDQAHDSYSRTGSGQSMCPFLHVSLDIRKGSRAHIDREAGYSSLKNEIKGTSCG